MMNILTSLSSSHFSHIFVCFFYVCKILEHIGSMFDWSVHIPSIFADADAGSIPLGEGVSARLPKWKDVAIKNIEHCCSYNVLCLRLSWIARLLEQNHFSEIKVANTTPSTAPSMPHPCPIHVYVAPLLLPPRPCKMQVSTQSWSRRRQKGIGPRIGNRLVGGTMNWWWSS